MLFEGMGKEEGVQTSHYRFCKNDGFFQADSPQYSFPKCYLTIIVLPPLQKQSLQQILFPMKVLLFVLLLLSLSAYSFNIHKPSLLRNCQIQLQKMTQAYDKGDTSLAFSIALKVYFAVQTLHQDLDIQQESIKVPQESINCQDSLLRIITHARSNNWQENFQEIMTETGVMQSKCTNSDFHEPQSSNQLDSGFQNQCALCVVILRVMENYVSYHKVAVADFVNKQFCEMFDNVIKPTCEAFIHFAGPVIIQTLVNKQPSDKVCIGVGLCQNKECKIVNQKMLEYNLPEIQAPTIPSPWKWLIHLFVDHFGNGHFPAFDLDNDTYSDVSTFRGYHWRASDCNQIEANIYPGRKSGSKLMDQDCNGIFGLDNRGRLYEDKFCAPYKRYGVAVIGDSAGAHFSIPEKYFNVTMMGKGTFNDLLPRLADELDLPHESGYTGHTNTPYPSRSIYKYLRDWNLCNHNDFQNIGVNGGDSGNTWGNIMALKRNQKEDYPLLMFMELIGNDVCKKSFESMRKPEDFKANIIKLLDHLDTVVPAGSHLIILGLGDGDILYQNLHDEIHPLNVTYKAVYDFLNCLKISPCWGWLNSNDTVRQFTTERANNLSKVYSQIIAQRSYKNFDMVYYDFPAWQILQRKVMQGGDPKTMIQRCDGFHPNGLFHSYLADWLWVKIRTEHPDWIGAKNPHNEQIRNIFGLEILK